MDTRLFLHTQAGREKSESLFHLLPVYLLFRKYASISGKIRERTGKKAAKLKK